MIDIGLNLAHDSFDHDRAAVIDSALNAGMRHMVVTGTSFGQLPAALALVHTYPHLLSMTAGIHPHHANELDAPSENAKTLLIQQLSDWARRPEVVAVGECGLDYHRHFQEKNVQVQSFEKQIELSLEINKPLFLHVRDAHTDFTALLKAAGRALNAVVHCFTGTESELEDYLSLGCHIGITGWVCDERRGTHILEFLSKIPDDRLMIETDAPYLLPRTLIPKPKDRRNEPRYLQTVAETVAQARGQSLEALLNITENNAMRFFKLRPDQIINFRFNQ